MVMRFDLNEFPSNPPMKWLTQNYNCVQLTLQFLSIDCLEIRGWNLDNIGDIQIDRSSERLQCIFNGKTTQIKCMADFISIAKISAYTK